MCVPRACRKLYVYYYTSITASFRYDEKSAVGTHLTGLVTAIVTKSKFLLIYVQTINKALSHRRGSQKKIKIKTQRCWKVKCGYMLAINVNA